MKIVASNIAHLSESQFERKDLSFEEETETRLHRFQGRRPGLRQNSADLSQGLINRVLIDRVSIQQKEQTEYQSNYFSNLSRQSTVTDNSKGEVIEYDQQYAMEKLVGGVIDKDLVIKKMEQGEGIQLLEVKGEGTENSSEGHPNRSQSQIQNSIQNQSSQSWQMSIQQTDIHFESEKVDFSSKGEVVTDDGRRIQFSLDMSLDRTFVSQTQKKTISNRWKEQINLIDPLVISLDGKTPALSDTRFEFDLNSDGKEETINFVNPGSGFLAFEATNVLSRDISNEN